MSTASISLQGLFPFVTIINFKNLQNVTVIPRKVLNTVLFFFFFFFAYYTCELGKAYCRSHEFTYFHALTLHVMISESNDAMLCATYILGGFHQRFKSVFAPS